MLTAQKNGVVATNGLNQTWGDLTRKQHGSNTSSCLVAPGVVYTGAGTLCSVSIVVSGDEIGFIHDAASTDKLDDTTRLMALPKQEGVTIVSFAVTSGITVLPGKGQSVTVTYSGN